MSSVHGHRGHVNSPGQRIRITVRSSVIPAGGVARVRPTIRPIIHGPSTTRLHTRAHSSTAVSMTTRRNAASAVTHVSSSQDSAGTAEASEVIDLTVPTQSSRRAQLPVLLGRGTSMRAPATRSKAKATSSKPNLRKRPNETSTTAAAAVDVSPTKKYRNMQEIMCPICFDEISLTNSATGKPIYSTTCGHLFCKPCISSCLERNNSCPMCRKCQTVSDIHPIYISNEKF